VWAPATAGATAPATEERLLPPVAPAARKIVPRRSVLRMWKSEHQKLNRKLECGTVSKSACF